MSANNDFDVERSLVYLIETQSESMGCKGDVIYSLVSQDPETPMAPFTALLIAINIHEDDEDVPQHVRTIFQTSNRATASEALAELLKTMRETLSGCLEGRVGHFIAGRVGRSSLLNHYILCGRTGNHVHPPPYDLSLPLPDYRSNGNSLCERCGARQAAQRCYTAFEGDGRLPNGWQQQTTIGLGGLGRVYYSDHNTRTTTWDDPRRAAQRAEKEIQRKRRRSM